MTAIKTEITIKRPAAEVFDFISNPENNPQWQNGMQLCKITSDPPWGLGSTYYQKASFLGREIISNFEITAFEPGRMIRGETVESSFPITFTRTVSPGRSEDSCLVQVVVTGDSTGFFKLFAPAIEWMIGRSIRKDYARLKLLLEA